MIKIIDVSNNNGHVDFVAAKKEGAVGVYLKVTEGSGFVDNTYVANRKAAKAAGLKVGGYHFAHPEGSGRSEAAFFLSHLIFELGDLVPMLDMESEAGWPTGYCHEFIPAVKAKHQHCGLYCGGWFITKYGLEAYRPRWIPSYGARPTLQFDAWQFSDGQAKYPGAILHLDTSEVTSLARLTGASKPKPAPKPKSRWVWMLGLKVRRGGRIYRMLLPAWRKKHPRKRYPR